ncbi:MAG: FKBP-type peptidyl-prolyl cis-trans isomerase [Candidatus Aphodosoma sp.]
MKKIFGLVAAATVTATMLVSCNGAATARVETANDTINYAFGAANAAGIRQYVLNDSLSAEQLKAFCNGFNASFNNNDRAEVIKTEGYRMGSSMQEEIKTGFLFNDSSAVVNRDLMMKTFADAVNGDYFMQPADAMQKFQTLMAPALSTGGSANLTPEQSDSVCMYFALINGHGARRYLIAPDTTKKNIRNFLAAVEKGMDETGNENTRWYNEGIKIGSTIAQQMSMSQYLFNDSAFGEIKRDVITRGLTDVITGEENAIMKGEEAQNYLNAIFEARSAREAAKADEIAAANKAKGEAFLAENAGKEGVISTGSGLQYKVVTMGDGAKPSATDKVKVHYHGTLTDGTVFDSSVERGEPSEFPVDGVIKGWTEGLQLMPVGSKFIFYIPYDLAYGERGAGSDIGPCETLVFEVELLDIVK